jgi:hypothetical protein
MTPSRRTSRAQPGAVAIAIKRGDWERASLLLLIGIALAARRLPPGTIDDVLAIITREAPDDGA